MELAGIHDCRCAYRSGADGCDRRNIYVEFGGMTGYKLLFERGRIDVLSRPRSLEILLSGSFCLLNATEWEKPKDRWIDGSMGLPYPLRSRKAGTPGGTPGAKNPRARAGRGATSRNASSGAPAFTSTQTRCNPSCPWPLEKATARRFAPLDRVKRYGNAFSRRPQRTSTEAATIARPTVINPKVTRLSCQGWPWWPAPVMGESAAVPKAAARAVTSQFA
jgi:hypothetical protein